MDRILVAVDASVGVNSREVEAAWAQEPGRSNLSIDVDESPSTSMLWLLSRLDQAYAAE